MRFNIHFVLPKQFENTNVDEIDLDDPDQFQDSHSAWCLQTLVRMRKTDLVEKISYGHSPKESVINVIHCDDLKVLSLKDRLNFYFVSIVSDRRVFLDGSINVVQNFNQIKRSSDYWVPHWPQAGLISESVRNDKPNKRLVLNFYGLKKNSIEGRELGFSSRVKISIKPPSEWSNYAGCDGVIAIRRNSKELNSKPPTKLINAYLAEKPFIAGPDSAYQQIATPGEDYLLVTKFDDLEVQVLEQLNKPRDYSKLTLFYNAKRVDTYWVSFFVCTVAPNFYMWRNYSYPRRLVGACIGSVKFNLLKLSRRIKLIFNQY